MRIFISSIIIVLSILCINYSIELDEVKKENTELNLKYSLHKSDCLDIFSIEKEKIKNSCINSMNNLKNSCLEQLNSLIESCNLYKY